MDKTKIIYTSRSCRRVKTVGRILNNTFVHNSIDCKLLNMNDHGKSLFKEIINSYKIVKNYNKNKILILQHFKATFFGTFLKLFGYKNIVNVIYTNLTDYYNSICNIKKMIIKFMFFMVKNNLVTFVSSEAELKAKEKFNLKNTKTIYNIYNFIQNNKQASKAKQNIVLGTVSRLYSVKNIDLAIRMIYVSIFKPISKKKGFEKTDVGYLIKPIHEMKHLKNLDDYEREYVVIMENFIKDLRNSQINMNYDKSRFSDEVIVIQWKT